MPENNTAFGAGFVTFILSFVSLFTWIYLPSAYLIMYGIGAACFCISGLLYLIGGVKNGRNTIDTAFGFGLPGWGLIIVSCVLGIFWNQAQLNLTNTSNLLMFLFLTQWFSFNDIVFLLPMLMNAFTLGPRRYNIGLFGSIIHIPFTIIALILGIIALNSVREEKW
ncbi:MAG: hypothetical protein ACTSRG_10440 [Candidatus Helarchaeota archaeon]